MSATKAKELLNAWRRKPMEYITYPRRIFSELRRANLSLTDIGSTEHEIELLRRLGATQSAKLKLDEFRKDPSLFAEHTHYLRQTLETAGITLNDIGSNEEELEQLRKEGARLRSDMLLNELSQDPSINFNLFSNLHFNLTLPGNPPIDQQDETIHPIKKVVIQEIIRWLNLIINDKSKSFDQKPLILFNTVCDSLQNFHISPEDIHLTSETLKRIRIDILKQELQDLSDMIYNLPFAGPEYVLNSHEKMIIRTAIDLYERGSTDCTWKDMTFIRNKLRTIEKFWPR